MSPCTHSTDVDLRRARSSMRAEKSRPMTRPPPAPPPARGRPCRSTRRGRFPGPHDLVRGQPTPRRSSPAVMTRFITSYTGAMRSNMPRTSSAASDPDSCVMCAPPLDELVVDPELVETARDDEVDEVLDGVRAVVEARGGEEDHGAGFVERCEAAQVDRGQRRLARDEHELAALLQRHRCRAVDEVGHRAGGERAHGRHRTGTDDVGVDLRGAARVRAAPVVGAVHGDLPARSSPVKRRSTSSRGSDASR